MSNRSHPLLPVKSLVHYVENGATEMHAKQT